MVEKIANEFLFFEGLKFAFLQLAEVVVDFEHRGGAVAGKAIFANDAEDLIELDLSEELGLLRKILERVIGSGRSEGFGALDLVGEVGANVRDFRIQNDFVFGEVGILESSKSSSEGERRLSVCPIEAFMINGDDFAQEFFPLGVTETGARTECEREYVFIWNIRGRCLTCGAKAVAFFDDAWRDDAFDGKCTTYLALKRTGVVETEAVKGFGNDGGGT